MRLIVVMAAMVRMRSGMRRTMAGFQSVMVMFGRRQRVQSVSQQRNAAVEHDNRIGQNCSVEGMHSGGCQAGSDPIAAVP